MAKSNTEKASKEVEQLMADYEKLDAGVQKAQGALETAMAARSACVERIAAATNGVGVKHKGRAYIPMKRNEKRPENAPADWKPTRKPTWFFRNEAERKLLETSS